MTLIIQKPSDILAVLCGWIIFMGFGLYSLMFFKTKCKSCKNRGNVNQGTSDADVITIHRGANRNNMNNTTNNNDCDNSRGLGLGDATLSNACLPCDWYETIECSVMAPPKWTLALIFGLMDVAQMISFYLFYTTITGPAELGTVPDVIILFTAVFATLWVAWPIVFFKFRYMLLACFMVFFMACCVIVIMAMLAWWDVTNGNRWGAFALQIPMLIWLVYFAYYNIAWKRALSTHIENAYKRM